MNRWWYDGKRDFLDWIGLSNSDFHLHFEIGALLFFAILFWRCPYGLRIAWFVGFALQTVNETMDAVDWIRWTGEINGRDAAGDYWETAMWPTVLTVALWRLPLGTGMR
ncbi:MAG: hypothetical protein ACE368_06620 [Paracoccaceae bacterium]